MLGLAGIVGCGVLDGQPITAVAQGSGGATSSSTTASSAGETTSTVGGAGSGDGGGTSTSTGATFDCSCEGLGADGRCLRFLNACDQTVWAGASGETVPVEAFDDGVELAPGECVAMAFRSVVGGRAWGGTDCDGDVCASDGASGRGTLVQFDVPEDGLALYNVSLVDGFNLPIELRPTGVEIDQADGPCRAARCDASLEVGCPEALRRYDEEGAVAYCESICRACGACEGCNDCGDLGAEACEACADVAEVCCAGTGCESNGYTEIWASLCPSALTYAEDGAYVGCDRVTDFDLTFCP